MAFFPWKLPLRTSLCCHSTCWEAPRCYRSSRYSWERTICSSRERVIDAYAPPGIYVNAVLLLYYLRALRTITTPACLSMSVYLCPMPLPVPLEMLDVACNLFFSLSTVRWVWQLHSLKLTFARSRDTIMHYASCQTDYVSTS